MIAIDNYRLVSLLTMLIPVARLVDTILALTTVECLIDSGKHVAATENVSGQPKLMGIIQPAIKSCRDLGLRLAEVSLVRIVELDRDGVLTIGLLREHVSTAIGRIKDECSLVHFIKVTDINLYEEPAREWNAILECFPDARFDVEEAGKCLALRRHTSAVFHLMRILELALQAMARRLGMNENQNWEPILKRIDSELKKPFNQRDLQGQSQFLADFSSHAQAIKVAWRNEVMHGRSKYTEEEALVIYGATHGLMMLVAENTKRGPFLER